MFTHTRNWIMAGTLGLLVACGGGGGGNSAPGVEPGPPPPGQPIPPDPIPPAPSANPYAEQEVLNAFITSAALNGDNQPVIQFQLSDVNNVAITDLTSEDVRFVVSKLQTSSLGGMTGAWQAYVNTVADPVYGPGTIAKLQANYERDDENHDFGEFTNNGDGTYTYQFATDLTNLPQDILDQASEEDLDLSYDPNLTHRVSMQFDNAPGKANPHYDWVPATGATSSIFTMDIAATATCNRCHDPLAIHGGGRQEIQYCVTCHNPGTIDPDSGNTVDMKVMIHKIHMGANLPSVQDGNPYFIVGFRGSVHDYSNLHYPQDIRNCVNCHAGSATGNGLTYPDGTEYEVTLTSQGDNWANYPSQAACGSCHDALDFTRHAGGQPDDSNCASCHSSGGVAGSIQESHVIPTDEARKNFAAEIVSVSNTGQGEFPKVQYKVFNPSKGDEPYDLANDPVWTQVDTGASRLAIDLAWDTTDYTNTGNDSDAASAVSLDALQGTPVGDGSYIVESTVAIPDGSKRPFIPAEGSGVAGIEGHPAVNLGTEEEPDEQRIAFTNAHQFFSINEADGQAVERREPVEFESCQGCHQTLSLHGSNRTDDLQVCVACHNPRNTDREVREIARNPPTDGKDEESLDFASMVHGIHAAGIRENPLQIVGFQGFTTYIYDEETVHYPGNIGNCLGCHNDSGYTLPLPSGVLGVTVDTGEDHESPIDDTVVTPTTSACASCHDGDEAGAHMVANGGSFDTSQEAINSGEVVEQCSVCHGSGRTSDVSVVHPVGD